MSDRGGFQPPSGPPAGWYPDPYDPSGQRYWDGRAWDLTTPIASGPYAAHADDYPDVGDWLDRSFRTAFGRWRAVGLVALLTAPASTAFTYVALDRLLAGLVLEGDEVFGWDNDRIPAVLGFGAVAILISILGTLAVSVLVLGTVDDHRSARRSLGTEIRSASEALIEAVRIVPRALGWGLVLLAGLAAVTIVLGVLAVAAGAVVVLIMLVLMPAVVWLAIKWSFTIVGLVDRPGNPYRRSSRVSDGRWWRTFGRLLLIGIIAWLITAAAQTAASLISGSGWGGLGSGTNLTIDENGRIDRFVFDDEFRFGTTEIVVASISAVITTIVSSSVLAAATTILYRTRNPR